MHVPVMLLMDSNNLHGNDKRQRVYDAHLVFHGDADALENIFLHKSYLSVRGSTMSEASWMPASEAYLPLAEPGSATSLTTAGLERVS